MTRDFLLRENLLEKLVLRDRESKMKKGIFKAKLERK